MNKKQARILILYIAVILMMLISYFHIQPNFSYEQTHTSGEHVTGKHISVAMHHIHR